MIGLHVDFHFKGHGTFTGEVIGYDSKEDFGHRLLHVVKFTDGEIDEYPYPKIIKAHEDYLKPTAPAYLSNDFVQYFPNGPSGSFRHPTYLPTYNGSLQPARTGLHYLISPPNPN
jgi:hypothetical protein